MTKIERTWWYEFARVWWAIGTVEYHAWLKDRLVKSGRLIIPSHVASIAAVLDKVTEAVIK